MNIFEKILELLHLRDAGENDDYDEPTVTIGSVVFGGLLRATIVVLVAFFVVEYFDLRGFWYITAFFVWLFAAYPAYRQYSNYNRRIEAFQEETLCGKCKHFEPSGQLCKILDEHVTRNKVPCEGLSWEPINFDTE